MPHFWDILVGSIPTIGENFRRNPAAIPAAVRQLDTLEAGISAGKLPSPANALLGLLERWPEADFLFLAAPPRVRGCGPDDYREPAEVVEVVAAIKNTLRHIAQITTDDIAHAVLNDAERMGQEALTTQPENK